MGDTQSASPGFKDALKRRERVYKSWTKIREYV